MYGGAHQACIVQAETGHLNGAHTMNANEVRYSPKLDIRNIDALPRGLNCRYLMCVQGLGPELVAKQWHRKRPCVIPPIHVLVDLKG